MFFLKIGSYQSTPKNPYGKYSKRAWRMYGNGQNKTRNWRTKKSPWKLPSLSNFAQRHLHWNQPPWQIIRDLDTVSWQRWQRRQGSITSACYYKAKIGSFQLPVVKITPQSAKKSSDDDKSSAVISGSAPTRLVRELLANIGRPSLSQDSPDTPCTSDRVGGVRWRLVRPARHHRTNRRFRIVVRLPAVAAPFHQERAEISFFPQPLLKLLKLGLQSLQMDPWNRLCNLKILSRYL